MSKPTYQIVDLGVHHPDYFQGFGTSFTPFEHSTYGIGATAQEAYDDALDTMGSDVALHEFPYACPFGGVVPYEKGEENNESEFPYYHVGIRWNVPEPQS